jgi:hypothetical protein
MSYSCWRETTLPHECILLQLKIPRPAMKAGLVYCNASNLRELFYRTCLISAFTFSATLLGNGAYVKAAVIF